MNPSRRPTGPSASSRASSVRPPRAQKIASLAAHINAMLAELGTSDAALRASEALMQAVFRNAAVGAAVLVVLAEGMRAGYTAMARGSQADLVLSQSDAMDATLSGIDESAGELLESWPEVLDVDGMLMGNVQTEELPFFYFFGYDPEGFAIDHFRIVEGQALDEVRRVRGKPLLLGKSAADSLDKEVVIMHPGPINRGVEITSDVADSSQSIILNQVENGVAIRMAVIYLLASKIK
mgnify:CR=1 FL=1